MGLRAGYIPEPVRSRTPRWGVAVAQDGQCPLTAPRARHTTFRHCLPAAGQKPIPESQPEPVGARALQDRPGLLQELACPAQQELG